jgi:hypothetical protein
MLACVWGVSLCLGARFPIRTLPTFACPQMTFGFSRGCVRAQQRQRPGRVPLPRDESKPPFQDSNFTAPERFVLRVPAPTQPPESRRGYGGGS